MILNAKDAANASAVRRGGLCLGLLCRSGLSQIHFYLIHADDVLRERRHLSLLSAALLETQGRPPGQQMSDKSEEGKKGCDGRDGGWFRTRE